MASEDRRQNQKKPSIFAILVVLRRQPTFDGQTLGFPPIWLIVGVFFHRSLEGLNEFGRSGFVIGVA